MIIFVVMFTRKLCSCVAMSQNLLHGSKELHVTPNKNIFSVLMILTPRLENQAYRLTHLQDHLKMSEFSSVENTHSQILSYQL